MEAIGHSYGVTGKSPPFLRVTQYSYSNDLGYDEEAIPRCTWLDCPTTELSPATNHLSCINAIVQEQSNNWQAKGRLRVDPQYSSTYAAGLTNHTPNLCPN